MNDEPEDPTYQTVKELETECSSPTLLETLQPEPDSTGANQHKLVLTTDAVLEEIFEEGEVLAKLNAVYARVSRKSKTLSTAEEVHSESSNQEPHNDDPPPPPLPEKRFGIDQSSESKVNVLSYNVYECYICHYSEYSPKTTCYGSIEC